MKKKYSWRSGELLVWKIGVNFLLSWTGDVVGGSLDLSLITSQPQVRCKSASGNFTFE